MGQNLALLFTIVAVDAISIIYENDTLHDIIHMHKRDLNGGASVLSFLSWRFAEASKLLQRSIISTIDPRQARSKLVPGSFSRRNGFVRGGREGEQRDWSFGLGFWLYAGRSTS